MSELLASPTQIGLIVLRTVVVYAFVLAGFRLSGKREVGQLAPFDFALILLIANAVQNAMVGPDSVLLALNFGLGHLAARNRKLEKLLRGKARILVNRGHVDPDHLKAEGLSHEELMQALRENGCAVVEDCRLAVLEVDGTISVIPRQRG
jgi:uncharacterized membrane protein YcaP (DUF421 family)